MFTLIAYLLVVLCSLFGIDQDSYHLSNGITINNVDKVLVANSESFGDYGPNQDRCNYQIIIVNYTFDDSDLIFQLNCNRVEFSKVLAIALSDFTLVEY